MLKRCVQLACLLLLQSSLVFAEAPLYQQFPPSNDGTGKVFMGREIAHVMGYQGAAWLERESREKEERTDVLIQALGLKPNMVVADVGAGTGYLSRRMAEKVGLQGKVFAVDVQPEMVAKLRALTPRFQQISPVLSTERAVNLPENSLDLAIMVDVYHELAYPYEVVQSLLKALKPNARLVLVEYRAEDDRVPIKQSHKMSEQQIAVAMAAYRDFYQKLTARIH
jgi:ubiquinone/menaquinone biosynthesis C-methylase UbiE